MSDGRVKGCFKYGCGGCAMIVLLFALVVGTLTVLALMQEEGPVEDRAFDQALPSVTLPEPAEPPSGDPLRDVERGFSLAGHEVAEPGRIELDLSIGDFEVVPGPADQPVHVEGTWDTKRFGLNQTWETWGESGWTYRVEFGAKGFMSFMGSDKGPAPRLRIVIPRDHPFVLEGRIRMGESRIELGGLWVLDARLELGMGEHSLRFSEPLAAPMKGLDVRGSMGEIRIAGAGNASPASITVRHSTGALSLDLGGAWANDSEIRATGSMGECVVRVPQGVNVDIQDAALLLGERRVDLGDRPPAPPGAPTLHISVTQSLGAVSISD